jgi:peptide deformylase
MVYPIYVYGTTVLRKRAKEIDRNYPGLAQLISDMFETMKFSEGIGLAAPQIGLSIRLIVIDASEMEDEEEPELKEFKKVLINPEILKETGDAWVFNEGCLSLPNLREDVERQSKIRLRYFDENFNPHEEEFDGVKARIIQHEYDHLEGILFVDRINPIRKRLLNSRLKAIARGDSSIHYKIRTAGKRG